LTNVDFKAIMRIMKNGIQKRIAVWLELSEPFLSKDFSGKRRPSPAEAERLEGISGVSFRNWLRAPHDELKRKVILAYEVFCRHD